MKLNIEIEIPPESIRDLFVAAIEGGVNYWCQGIYLVKSEHPPTAKQWWYHDPKVYSGEFTIEIQPDDDEKVIVTEKDVYRALCEMPKSTASRWADIMNENVDTDTADVFIQLAAFKEMIYG